MLESYIQARADKNDVLLTVKNKIYEDLRNERSEEAIGLFTVNWGSIKSFIINGFYKKDEQGNTIKPEITDVDNQTDYKYEFYNWLKDMEIEYHNAKLYLGRVNYCREVLNLFAWKNESSENYKTAIAEALNTLERYDECDELLKSCIEEEPENINYINMYILCLSERKEWEEAEKLVEKYIKLSTVVDYENLLLFYRATEVYEALGDKEKLQQYREKIFDFKGRSGEEMDTLTEMILNLPDEKPKSEVKAKKPGRNDLCPCGSGKKYKKCCGKNE